MMPELGKYAFAVLSSYGVSLALLLVIVGQSVHRSRRIKRQLTQIEERRNAKD